MKKLGVYIACAFNPMFLRLCMLQMSQQVLAPDYIAIHENGLSDSFMWCCRDIPLKGKVICSHTPRLVRKSHRQLPALKALLATDCDYIMKADIDDFFYRYWTKNLVAEIETGEFDWVVNRRNAVCLIQSSEFNPTIVDAPAAHPPKVYYWQDVDFGKINPLGGMSDNVIFTRKVAEKYVMALEMMPDTADDVTLFNILPSFPNGKIVDGVNDSCYVSHGRNASTAVWQTYVPDFE